MSISLVEINISQKLFRCQAKSEKFFLDMVKNRWIIGDMIDPPKDTPEYMRSAWASALHVAIGQPEILQAFRDETGNKRSPGKIVLDRAIDEACGADRDFTKAFVVWFNERIWGSIE